MWTETNNRLVRDFSFPDFITAFAFIIKVALAAEAANHHPTIINTYNKVQLALSTHDAGNIITAKDRNLAATIDQLV